MSKAEQDVRDALKLDQPKKKDPMLLAILNAEIKALKERIKKLESEREAKPKAYGVFEDTTQPPALEMGDIIEGDNFDTFIWSGQSYKFKTLNGEVSKVWRGEELLPYGYMVDALPGRFRVYKLIWERA